MQQEERNVFFFAPCNGTDETKMTETLSKRGPSELDSCTTTGRKNKSFIYTKGKCQRTGTNLITCRCVRRRVDIIQSRMCVYYF